MPYEDVNGALKEIEYASHDLKVDGFVLVSNYKGIYLSDDRMDELFTIFPEYRLGDLQYQRIIGGNVFVMENN